jgi:hypothetical protein
MHYCGTGNGDIMCTINVFFVDIGLQYSIWIFAMVVACKHFMEK